MLNVAAVLSLVLGTKRELQRLISVYGTLLGASLLRRYFYRTSTLHSCCGVCYGHHNSVVNNVRCGAVKLSAFDPSATAVAFRMCPSLLSPNEKRVVLCNKWFGAVRFVCSCRMVTPCLLRYLHAISTLIAFETTIRVD